MSAEELKLLDEMFENCEYQDSLDMIQKLSDQESCEVKWRLARTVFFLSKQSSVSDEKEALVRQAFEHAGVALEKDGDNFGANKWYGAILSEKSSLDGVTERIKQLENVQKHFQRAVSLNGDSDPGIWHMLGQFNYKLSEVNWITRKLINSVAPNPPTASYAEALECFAKAESIKPNFYALNLLYLGKSHLALKQSAEAKPWLERAAAVEVRCEDDRICREEATELLKKL
ncbi:regulator of microtubule dynamics protein 1-like [Anopheles ziemanni]|uniref:regulator of microtubule dynamics protein 1-like n=1 Tax=Anopheles coustani TaxID=139045 RepID=UPI00265A00D2|nr:regulator of microtubule dynamics protein 1-like [Anopheles coustani]XP_058173880.1 regulator of microtubule dynamics protein 1-like [Anopheles ziemanni]